MHIKDSRTTSIVKYTIFPATDNICQRCPAGHFSFSRGSACTKLNFPLKIGGSTLQFDGSVQNLPVLDIVMEGEKTLKLFFESDVASLQNLEKNIVRDFFDMLGIASMGHTITTYQLMSETSDSAGRRLLQASTNSSLTVLKIGVTLPLPETPTNNNMILYISLGGGVLFILHVVFVLMLRRHKSPQPFSVQQNQYCPLHHYDNKA